MTGIHYFQRYSERENVVTNNTLLLFSRLYNASPQKFSSFLKELLKMTEDVIGVKFSQQVRAHKKGGIPDGEVVQKFFRLLIETKLENEVFDVAQIKRHIEHFDHNGMNVLLLLSPQTISEEKLSKMKSEVLGQENPKKVYLQSGSFNDVISKALDAVDFDIELKSVVEDFATFCSETNLLSSREYVMRAVPCGRTIKENLRLSIYFDPIDRAFSPHRYLGVYNEKAVRGVGKITCIADVDLEESGGLCVKAIREGELTDENKKNIKIFMDISPTEYGWDIRKDHRFFCVDRFYPTEFRKDSPNGMWGRRIFDLSTLIDFKNVTRTEDVANMLREKTWR